MTGNGPLVLNISSTRAIHSRPATRDPREDWILALGEPPLYVTRDFWHSLRASCGARGSVFLGGRGGGSGSGEGKEGYFWQ